MMAKSSQPFMEGQFVKERLMKASKISCPEKKVFERVSLFASRVASRVMDVAGDVQTQLIKLTQAF